MSTIPLPFAAPDPFAASRASVEPDALSRLLLVRRWAPGPLSGWVCLNPSTADAQDLDPTTRRIRGFSRAWGFSGFALVNLFAMRSTDPEGLIAAIRGAAQPPAPSGYAEAVHAENDDWIRRLARECPVVVCAWGSPRWGEVHRRAVEVHRLLASLCDVQRLGPPLQAGHPRHPLYAHGSLRLEPHPFALTPKEGP